MAAELTLPSVDRVSPTASKAPADPRGALLAVYTDEFPEGIRNTLSPADVDLFLRGRIAFLDADPAETVKVRVGPAQAPLAGDGDVTTIETRMPDCAFIVGTISEVLRLKGAHIDLIVHPLFSLTREGSGRVSKITLGANDGPVVSHAFIQVRGIPQSSHAALRDLLTERLEAAIAVDRDFAPILKRLDAVDAQMTALRGKPGPDAAEAADILELCAWLRDRNFVFLGYGFVAKGKPDILDPLGLLGFRGQDALRQYVGALAVSRLERNEVFTFYRTDILSPVRREAQMRYLGVRGTGPGGVIGEHVFVGLLSTAAAGERNNRIPVISRRMRDALAALDLRPGSFSHRKAAAILNSVPNEDLFYCSVPEICDLVRFLQRAEVTDATAVRVWRRRSGRRISIVAVVPRRALSETKRRAATAAIRQFLEVDSIRDYSGSSDAEGHVRLHFYVSRYREGIDDRALADLSEIVRRELEPWTNRLFHAVDKISRPGDTAETKSARRRRFADAFSLVFQQAHLPHESVQDVFRIEDLIASGEVQVAVDDTGKGAILSIYTQVALSLNDVVPVLDRLGIRAAGRVSEQVQPAGSPPVSVARFEVTALGGGALDATSRTRLAAVLRDVLAGRLLSDPLLGLALAARCGSREIELAVTFRNYFLQCFNGHAASSVNDAWTKYAATTRLALDYFQAKFDPAAGGDPASRGPALAKIEAAYLDSLGAVSGIQDDRILRLWLDLLRASLRTNFYLRRAGKPAPVISIKFDSQAIPDLPRPKPYREIFVHGPYVDAVHLRGGPVARGGIRHSDRPDDFRQEILGLMKTQMTKNSVIVPQGSKGGFVIVRNFADQAKQDAEVRSQYEQFVSGLLDITDNIVDGRVVPPSEVLRYDSDDPYLVVAADKGTAKFSDFANAISERYGFWLGDAFASGGSIGYDHKKIGITARGAWESVKRHFADLDVDLSTTLIRVSGVGDMSGDVFGNGLLLSPRVQLVAAFNHKHIFIDPSPDPVASLAERTRLFNLPRSQWSDYNPKTISAGGGVFERAAKRLDLSPQAREALGLPPGAYSGLEVIRAILKAPVDLMWLGGIGTYVKASTETHADANDKINDGCRVDANEVRARVIGEGANLGFTARARIEYFANGGRGNTDALDNSGGVECSDREVNLKILFRALMAAGHLKSREERDKMLREMEPQVAERLLQTNAGQSLLVSREQIRSQREWQSYIDLIAHLRQVAGLSRADEQIPNDDALRALGIAGKGTPRSVLAILTAYAKNHLRRAIVQSTVPDQPELAKLLTQYFPPLITQKYGPYLKLHPLWREIISTVLANQIVNRTGPTLLTRAESLGVDAIRYVTLYQIANVLMWGDDIRSELEAASKTVAARHTYAARIALDDALRAATAWATRVLGESDTAESLRAPFDAACAALLADLDPAGRERLAAREAELAGQGFAAPLAARIAALPEVADALAVAGASRATGATPSRTAALHRTAGTRLGLDGLAQALGTVVPTTPWERDALGSLSRRLMAVRERALVTALKAPGDPFEALAAAHGPVLERIQNSVRSITRDGGGPLAMFVVLEQVEEVAAKLK